MLIVAFLYWELHTPHAMMPLRFFRIPAFSAGNTVAFAVSLGMFATFFFLSLYMQLIRGYTPFQAGVRFLPMTLMIIVTAPLAGKYASKHGSRAPMTYGLILSGAGLLFFGTQLQVDTSYWLIAPVFIIMGHGMASVMAPMTAAVMNAVGPQRAGLGSAMTNTSREVGGVFGIALLGTILTTKLKSSLTTSLVGLGLTSTQQSAIAIGGRARDARSLTVLQSLGLTATQHTAVVSAFDSAFMDGFHVALFVAGTVLVVRRSSPTGSSPGDTRSTCRRPAITRRSPSRSRTSVEHAVERLCNLHQALLYRSWRLLELSAGASFLGLLGAPARVLVHLVEERLHVVDRLGGLVTRLTCDAVGLPMRVRPDLGRLRVRLFPHLLHLALAHLEEPGDPPRSVGCIFAPRRPAGLFYL